jgi:ribonuclease HII
MGLFQAVPTVSAELAAWRQGHRLVAGVDEAGRGPLAGPVVAAAVILEPDRPQAWWAELRDSKMLPYEERERLGAIIAGECASGVGVASHRLIDSMGLIAATKLAMRRAIAALPCRPDMLLIDAVALPEYRHEAIIHGDALCASIAAGSIVAKVARDAIMADYHERYPRYAFNTNRGYATPEHMQALDEHGPCTIHRRLFAPVREALERRRFEPAAGVA